MKVVMASGGQGHDEWVKVTASWVMVTASGVKVTGEEVKIIARGGQGKGLTINSRDENTRGYNIQSP